VALDQRFPAALRRLCVRHTDPPDPARALLRTERTTRKRAMAVIKVADITGSPLLSRHYPPVVKTDDKMVRIHRQGDANNKKPRVRSGAGFLTERT